MLWDIRLDQLKVSIEERYVDPPASRYLKVEAIWMTIDGKCDDVPDWAKEYWLQYQTTTRGGAQHAFALVLDEDGIPLEGVTMRLQWPDGHDDRLTPAPKPEEAGWANIPVWANYDPAQGPGPYDWFPLDAGDLVHGLGLPHNHHISVFVVYRVSGPISPPPPPPPPPPLEGQLRVYIAGPMALGDHDANTRAFIHAADRVMDVGHIPFVPALTHLWNLISWHPREFWFEYDLAWLHVCDVLLRLPGTSAGADAEEAYAIEHEIPIYHSVMDLPIALPVHSLFIPSSRS